MKRLTIILSAAIITGLLSSCGVSYYSSTSTYDADDVYGNSAARSDELASTSTGKTETDEEFDKYLSEGEYSPEADYYDPDRKKSDTSYSKGGDTYYIDEYNDYSYANRIQRFNNPYYGYYDPFYTSSALYVGFGWGSTPFWYRPNRWNYYAGWYNPWYSPWYGYYSPWNNYNYWYGGYGYGYGNYWSGYNNGYYAGAYGYPYGYGYGYGYSSGYGGGGWSQFADNSGSSGSSYYGHHGSTSTGTSSGGSTYDDNNSAASYGGLAKPAPEAKLSKPESLPAYSGPELEGASLVDNGISGYKPVKGNSLTSSGNKGITPDKTNVIRGNGLISKPQTKPTRAKSPWGKKPESYREPEIEYNRTPYNNNWNKSPERNPNNNYNNYYRTPPKTPSTRPGNKGNNRTPSTRPSQKNNYNRGGTTPNRSYNSPSRGSSNVNRTPSRTRSSGSSSRSRSSTTRSGSSSSSKSGSSSKRRR